MVDPLARRLSSARTVRGPPKAVILTKPLGKREQCRSVKERITIFSNFTRRIARNHRLFRSFFRIPCLSLHCAREKRIERMRVKIFVRAESRVSRVEYQQELNLNVILTYKCSYSSFLPNYYSHFINILYMYL